MAEYIVQRRPFVVPTSDGKRIEEHFGRASEQVGDYSIAHMIAPEAWSEPAQTPDFDEITIMISGRLRAVVGEDLVEVKAGESIFVPRGVRVRYSNPFGRPAEYWSVCIPAFTLESAHRED